MNYFPMVFLTVFGHSQEVVPRPWLTEGTLPTMFRAESNPTEQAPRHPI
jgi:hypothetical protein